MPSADPKPAIAWLKRNGTKAHRDGLSRFALPPQRALGVTVGKIQALAKELGSDHARAKCRRTRPFGPTGLGRVKTET